MDNVLPFIESLVSLLVTIILIIFVFLFVVKPILNYIMVNREIENRKKLALEYEIAKREAEALRKENNPDGETWPSGDGKMDTTESEQSTGSLASSDNLDQNSVL